MNRNDISKGFQDGLMAARIKSTFMLQVSSGGRNSYRVEKESLQLNVRADLYVVVDMAIIELLIVEQEWMFNRRCVVLAAVGEK